MHYNIELKKETPFFIDQAQSLNVCLSPTTRSGLYEFVHDGECGVVAKYYNASAGGARAGAAFAAAAGDVTEGNSTAGGGGGGALPRSTVFCVPLFSVLTTLGNPVVDYLSLDVGTDGRGELDILRTVPWDRVNVSMASVAMPASESSPLFADIVDFMSGRGYRRVYDVREVGAESNRIVDVVFAKANMLKGLDFSKFVMSEEFKKEQK